MINISQFQFFLLTTTLMIGSAVLFPLGIGANQNAYLVVLIGMFLAIGLSFVYIKLHSLLPKKTFIEVLQLIYGEALGWILGLIYSTFFLYIGVRNLRDLGEQVIQFAMPGIDMEIVIFFSVILIIYGIYNGIETIARANTLTFAITALTLCIVQIYTSIYISDPQLLKPFLAQGVGPVLEEIYPDILAFPFAELAALMMIFPYVINEDKNLRKTFIGGIILGSIIITLNTIVIITSLGTHLAAETNFPLMKVGQLPVNELIKFDFFINLATTIILIAKIQLLTYCGLKGYRKLFGFSYNKLCILTPLIMGYLAYIIAESFPEHIDFGLGTSLYINLAVGIYLPLTTLMIYYLKRWISGIL
ncbi:GerAB/ArcD/ProY family transporter [Halonatronum saccharophilum]|uniref:GerAB/ArcD/ProY family transporter n=1 Tax=Halonatronum saccharophilum TaxID=150060 RepID=UPI00048A1295|nr:endospore germination permease [Halonatronum saccharophilum]